MKNPLTPAGIEPATFRFVAQHLNHCATAVPLRIQRSRVRSPALPDFLSSSGSGTGSTQPREVNWGATWMKKSGGSRSRKQRLTAVGTRWADHVTPLYPQKLALTPPTGGGRSVGIVRVRTKATEYNCNISNKDFLEECDKEEHVEVSGAAATSCLRRITQ